MTDTQTTTVTGRDVQTYKVTIRDGDTHVEMFIEAESLEGACDQIEKRMTDAEAESDSADRRDEWTCMTYADYHADCSLSSDGAQDSATWAKAVIELVCPDA